MIYTIGHSNRSAEVFLKILQHYGIGYLVDVRSKPYSKYNKQYNKTALQAYLKENGITYVFMGDELGGRPNDACCYVEGKLSYNLVKQQGFFKHGIERLKVADAKELPVAIMCSEAKPQDCHRARLISPVLHAEGIEVIHINEKAELSSYEEIDKILKEEKGLFG